MILRLTDRAEKIVHVPRLMYYWRSHEGSTAASIDAKPYAIEAAKGAVADHLKKHGFKHFQITSTRACATIFRIRYQILGDPKISIVIANKDHVEDLKRCITSIQKNSTWSNYEIIVVENNSTTPEIKDYYSQLLGLSGDDSYEERCKLHTVCGHDGGILHSGDGRISIVTYHGDFNYSAVNDLGASYASGEYILLLNNDTEVITANWMEEMLMYAQREDVGAVGAKAVLCGQDDPACRRGHRTGSTPHGRTYPLSHPGTEPGLHGTSVLYPECYSGDRCLSVGEKEPV